MGVEGVLADSGGEWRVHAPGNGCAVASRLPLTPIETGDGRYAAAGVELPSGERLLVVSVHFKCCGVAGSEEDLRRVEEAEAVANTIAVVRSAQRGSPAYRFRDAGVVVAGDWNLVGSDRPLEVLRRAEPSGPGLTRATLLGLNGDAAVTWYNESSSFSPGWLDLVAFDDATLDLMRGFVLNTRVLDAAALARMGLAGDDSRLATDHLMLVADLAFDTPAGDGSAERTVGDAGGDD
jgi:hypothetical protein